MTPQSSALCTVCTCPGILLWTSRTTWSINLLTTSTSSCSFSNFVSFGKGLAVLDFVQSGTTVAVAGATLLGSVGSSGPASVSVFFAYRGRGLSILVAGCFDRVHWLRRGWGLEAFPHQEAILCNAGRCHESLLSCSRGRRRPSGTGPHGWR